MRFCSPFQMGGMSVSPPTYRLSSHSFLKNLRRKNSASHNYLLLICLFYNNSKIPPYHSKFLTQRCNGAGDWNPPPVLLIGTRSLSGRHISPRYIIKLGTFILLASIFQVCPVRLFRMFDQPLVYAGRKELQSKPDYVLQEI